VSAVSLTPADVPEAAVAGDIAADLGAAGWHLAELHIGRAYLFPVCGTLWLRPDRIRWSNRDNDAQNWWIWTRSRSRAFTA
jgi:hypothetical protein